MANLEGCQERVLAGRLHFKYYPDVQVFLADGREWWFEVKPHERLKIASVRQRLDAAERYFNATARNFSVVTERLIEAEPLATNLRRLMYHRRGPELSHQALEEVMVAFNKWPPTTVADLLCVVGERKAWRLLGLGVVGIDLDRSIDTDSPVFLQGGHRHANLFP
ncbi:TnsA endonuclease N-terminal domain-containing protein [Pseudomonas sp. DWP2-2]|uniref:TnsA endonuclease N-terminal domain-containing protein n=1 Tax=Pseudomonas sp. DWP2-2 TaxID=2804609 RepID=UPI003CF166F8